MKRVLPLFPLGSVLLPHGVLPLHIFEPRYRAMMESLDPLSPEFGVVLIERGSEVGGSDVRSTLGTVARVVESAELPDGRWVLIAVGAAPFSVQRWLPDDPFPRAEILERADGAWDPGRDGDLFDTERAVRRALALASELGESNAVTTFELQGSPLEKLWQLAVLAPLGPTDRQRLLACEDPGPRCTLLGELVRDVTELLAFRMGGG
jgi:Lon protease-like protein